VSSPYYREIRPVRPADEEDVLAGKETVEEFLARGGKIQHIPIGVSSEERAELTEAHRKILRHAK